MSKIPLRAGNARGSSGCPLAWSSRQYSGSSGGEGYCAGHCGAQRPHGWNLYSGRPAVEHTPHSDQHVGTLLGVTSIIFAAFSDSLFAIQLSMMRISLACGSSLGSGASPPKLAAAIADRRGLSYGARASAYLPAIAAQR